MPLVGRTVLDPFGEAVERRCSGHVHAPRLLAHRTDPPGRELSGAAVHGRQLGDRVTDAVVERTLGHVTAVQVDDGDAEHQRRLRHAQQLVAIAEQHEEIGTVRVQIAAHRRRLALRDLQQRAGRVVRPQPRIEGDGVDPAADLPERLPVRGGQMRPGRQQRGVETLVVLHAPEQRQEWPQIRACGAEDRDPAGHRPPPRITSRTVRATIRTSRPRVWRWR